MVISHIDMGYIVTLTLPWVVTTDSHAKTPPPHSTASLSVM